MNELKPCPHCGGDATIQEQMDRLYIEAKHTKNCILRPNTWLISALPITKQIEAWNRRADETEGNRYDTK